MAAPLATLETIDLIYQAALEPERWQDALHRLALATGGFGTAMIPITPGNTTGLVVSHDLAESRIEYDREWWRHDTRVQRIFSRKLTDGVCCEAELFTEDEIKRDPMRQEFCRPYNMGAFAAQLVTPMPDFVVAFSVQRAVALGHFEKRDLEALKLLGRHAARALLISARLAGVRRLGQTVTQALERFDCGALVVDRDLKILFANEPAERLFGDGLAAVQGRLHSTHRMWRDALNRFLVSVLQKCPEPAELGPIALPRPSGRRPLLVQAVPISIAQDDEGLACGPAALVIVVDPERQGDYGVTQLLRLLGLTPSEARLAELIGAGRSRAAAADALGISEATASDAIKQVYSKLDISRQSELVRLVERLAVLRPGRDGNSEELPPLTPAAG
ncbi:MAG: helix-turn-helix transcriptional regulator [Xanthobacteraceae bacterium]